MSLAGKEDIIRMVHGDNWMMDVLAAARTLQLPDWWICAGFVRAKIWDVLHGYETRTPLPDVDLIYFDGSHLDEETEKKWELKLRSSHPHIPWSIKNEARLHLVNSIPPYTSSTDAISKFPETATALGLKLDGNNQLILTAPCGLHDVIQLAIRPTPYFSDAPERLEIYQKRLAQKNWQVIWPKVNIVL